MTVLMDLLNGHIFISNDDRVEDSDTTDKIYVEAPGNHNLGISFIKMLF